MSFRRLGAFLILSSIAAAFPGAAGGCSSDDAHPGTTSTSGDAAPEANRPAPTDDDGGTPRTCRERCEDQHPNALTKDRAIDTCWETYCAAPCIKEEEPTGDAGLEGGAPDASTPDGGTCVSPVVTISPSCDQCTTAYCCASWDGCFQDSECAALESCYAQCED